MHGLYHYSGCPGHPHQKQGRITLDQRVVGSCRLLTLKRDFEGLDEINFLRRSLRIGGCREGKPPANTRTQSRSLRRPVKVLPFGLAAGFPASNIQTKDNTLSHPSLGSCGEVACRIPAGASARCCLKLSNSSLALAPRHGQQQAGRAPTPVSGDGHGGRHAWRDLLQ